VLLATFGTAMFGGAGAMVSSVCMFVWLGSLCVCFWGLGP
jgi:hypothetical protein